MESLCSRIRQSNHATIVRMEAFVEEQNVRKLLGPQLWKELCDDLEGECRNLNQAEAGILSYERSALRFTARNQRTARVLRLRYEDVGPGIPYAVGIENGVISFRVNTSPVVSLFLVLNGNTH